VDGSIGPVRDIETINLELIFADLELLEKRMDKIKKQAKSGEKQYFLELEFLEKIHSHLESNQPARTMKIEPEWEKYMEQLFLLTSKPLIYCANVAEEDIQNSSDNPYVKELMSYAEKENAEVLVVCANIEEEISQLEDQEKQMFISELGLGQSGLDRLIHASYELLGLISFLTAGESEVRAWTIKRGTKAPQAAGKIHSDFERGFIRAEIVPFDDLIRLGSYNAAKEQGLVRSEGKEYIMKDGDVTLFRFNV
jgi:GTP-binding protein YchF